jgi:hypothetical protein
MSVRTTQDEMTVFAANTCSIRVAVVPGSEILQDRNALPKTGGSATRRWIDLYLNSRCKTNQRHETLDTMMNNVQLVSVFQLEN